jgi:peptide/nickel transport system substrate-binding protein
VIRENLPPAEANERILFENDYDLAMQGIALVDTGPYGRLSRSHSTSPNNRPGVDDAGIDAALEQLRVAVDEDEIVDAMAELQTAWNEVLPLVTYTAGEWFIAADHDVVRGLAFTADVTTMFHQAYVVR